MAVAAVSMVGSPWLVKVVCGLTVSWKLTRPCTLAEHLTNRILSMLMHCLKCKVIVLLLISVLWHCWLDIRKSIRPVKNWVMGYWRGYLSGVWCKWFAYGPADATATPSSLASVKSRMVYLSGAGLPRLSWKRPLNVCMLILDLMQWSGCDQCSLTVTTAFCDRWLAMDSLGDV